MTLTLGEEILILLKERGPLTIEEIAEYLGRDLDDVKAEIDRLELNKLVSRSKKGLLIRREVFDLTPTGLDEAEKAIKKLNEEAQKIKERLASGDADPQDLLQDYGSILPLLILLNLLPAELLEGMSYSTYVIDEDYVYEE